MNSLLTGDHVSEADTPLPGSLLTCTPAPRNQLDRTSVVPVDPLSRAPSQSSVGIGNRCERFPALGETFLGFQLVEVLGTGAFAQVYLAHQVDLSDRTVALKVTTRPTPEPQRLARLRHTNIVPIHSVHDHAPLQAVCMPFLGRCTLADVLEEYRERGVFPQTSAHLASTAALAATTQITTRSTGPIGIPVPDPVVEPASQLHALPNQVEFVLWVLARLAEGLAHAHDRGILHLDLKPANVLLADDGQPLLLDFNLSYDVRSDDRPRTGGTLPYMAPEQLEEYRDGGPMQVDQRTDLFALGVIAFELLTGRKPYPIGPDKKRNISEMIAVRRSGAFHVRQFNPSVSPAVEAIVAKLLHPKPAGRYQSARDLVEDLDRHAHHLPLRHAADRSLTERIHKWRRRNPKAPLLIAVAALAAAAATLGVAASRQAEARRQGVEERARIDAAVRAQALRAELAALRVDLTSRDHADLRKAARERGQELLALYGFPGPIVPDAERRLADERRADLGDDLGELALLMAHSAWLDGRGRAEDERVVAAEAALEWNRVAEDCFAGRTAPSAVTLQRRRLATEAKHAVLPAAPAVRTETLIDLYLGGSELIADGHFSAAAVPLELLTTRAPGHYAGQFAVGVCRQETGAGAQAQERYRVAQALMPTDDRPAFNRGAILFHAGDTAGAARAFSEAIERNPSRAVSYQYRASSRLALREYGGAIADLKQALALGAPVFHIRYQLARAYEDAGDPTTAAEERAIADKLAPVDPVDYLFRARSRRTTDPKQALADYAKAAELNPHSVTAWQNQASLLADGLGELDKALAAQEKAVETAPEYARARSGRAVLYARAGRRIDAHRDAEYALVLSGDPWVTYEAACVYALTAAKSPGDWAAAENLFRRALREGFRNFAHIEADSDLKEALKRPAFRDALAAARVLSR